MPLFELFKFSRYELMQLCWQESPDDRPSFSQLRDKLEEMMQVDNPYLDLSNLDESRAYYNVPSFNSANEETTDSALSGDEQAQISKDSRSESNVTMELENEDNEMENARVLKLQPSLETDQTATGQSVEATMNPFNTQAYPRGVSNLKDVKINLDDLEKQLYRSKNRNFVLWGLSVTVFIPCLLDETGCNKG